MPSATSAGNPSSTVLQIKQGISALSRSHYVFLDDFICDWIPIYRTAYFDIIVLLRWNGQGNQRREWHHLARPICPTVRSLRLLKPYSNSRNCFLYAVPRMGVSVKHLSGPIRILHQAPSRKAATRMDIQDLYTSQTST